MNILKFTWQATSAITKAAKGEQETDLATSKLENFLTSLVTYPFLHLASLPNIGAGSRKFHGPVSSAAHNLLTAVRTPGIANAPAGPSLSDYSEGKALVSLEKWCHERVIPTKIDKQLLLLREWLQGYLAWSEETKLKTYGGRIDDVRTLSPNQEPAQETATASTWLVQGAGLLIRLLDIRLGPSPPSVTVDMIVGTQLDLLPGSTALAAPGIKPGVGPAPPDSLISDYASSVDSPAGQPIARVCAAVSGNIHYVTQELQHRYHLSRGKTWLEVVNSLLSIVRIWLTGVALFFYLLATLLRIGGNGLSALGGLVAFTVVLSIAISVLSALTFLSASAADATGTFLEYMARFTDIAKRRTSGRAAIGPQDKLGPQSLGSLSFEELEDFFALQLSGSPARRSLGTTGGVALRNRPDIPRIAHDQLLVLCYDAGIVDSRGAVLPYVAPDDVSMNFDPEGFFGYATPLARKGAATLLLRLLCWKHLATIMMSSAGPVPGGAAAAGAGAGGDVIRVPDGYDRALKYVFIGGVPGAGATSLYKTLAGLPQDYKLGDAGPVGGMQPILRDRTAVAVLANDNSPGGKEHWIKHPNHGIISCLVFLVPAAASIKSLGLTGDTGGGIDSGAVPGGDEAGSMKAGGAGGGSGLEDMWQVVGLRKPVLFIANKASTVRGGVADVVQNWSSALKEEAHRRGLESEYITVMVTDLTGTPPPGAVGLSQVQDWLAAALSTASQQR